MTNLAGWPYWKVISITGQAGSGTDYQVELEIGDSAGGNFHLEGHCDVFPQDIRITDDDGTTLLDHFVEDLTADPIVVYVEVKDDLDSNQDIRVYYGKSGESTASDIDATMVFGDDFADNSIDGAKWSTIVGSISETGGELVITRTGGTDADIRTIPSFLPGHTFRARLKVNGGGSNIQQFGLSNRTTNINWVSCDDGAWYYASTPSSLHSYTNNETVVTSNNNTRPNNGVYHIYDINWLSAQVKFYKDGALLQTHTTNIPDEACYSGGKARSFDGSVLTYDWIAIRKYNSPEPAFSSAGAEQTPGWTGTILGVTNPAKVIGIDVSNIAKVMNI